VSGGLDASESLLVDVSAALAVRGDDRPLEAALDAALAGGVDPLWIEEALLQAYLFLGYPRALGAFGLWRARSGRPAPPPLDEDWTDWKERGADVCRRVYAGQYEGLRRNVRALHSDLETWMLVEGYGKVLGRPGLPLRTRELCIAALLAVLDAPAQLHSHLRGALNVGVTPHEVGMALARALRCADAQVGDRAEETWRKVRSRWDEPERTRAD